MRTRSAIASGVDRGAAVPVAVQVKVQFQFDWLLHFGLGCGLGGVELRLDDSEHGAEEKVPPGGLGKGSSIACELGQLVSSRVEAISQSDCRPRCEMLGHSRCRTPEGRWDRCLRRHVGVDRTEQCSVEEVHHKADPAPPWASSHSLAEKLYVAVSNSKDRLVERLEDRPDERRHGSCQRAPECSCSGRLHFCRVSPAQCGQRSRHRAAMSALAGDRVTFGGSRRTASAIP
jgi:hypothetical protein